MTLTPRGLGGDIPRGSPSLSGNEDIPFRFFSCETPKTFRESSGQFSLLHIISQGGLREVDTYFDRVYKKYWMSSGAARPLAQLQFMKSAS